MNFSGLCMIDRSKLDVQVRNVQVNIWFECWHSCERSRGSTVPSRPLDVKEQQKCRKRKMNCKYRSLFGPQKLIEGDWFCCCYYWFGLGGAGAGAQGLPQSGHVLCHWALSWLWRWFWAKAIWPWTGTESQFCFGFLFACLFFCKVSSVAEGMNLWDQALWIPFQWNLSVCKEVRVCHLELHKHPQLIFLLSSVNSLVLPWRPFCPLAACWVTSHLGLFKKSHFPVCSCIHE